jgi:hypothetical protein
MNIEDISTQAATWPVELILRNAVNFSSLEFVADWWRERSAELFSFEAQKVHSTAVENSSVCRILRVSEVQISAVTRVTVVR